ncbi:MAG: N-acetyltransferase [Actinobacteria bacterium]|nr:MAG: N-acetyltransferase [Actinomycetota bacterium]
MREVTELRWEVLMAPFGVSRDDDWHDDDPQSHHLVAVEDGRVIGYSRLIQDGCEGQIRQVAVSFDRQRAGIGSAMLAETVTKARELGLDPIFLHARTRAETFYQRLGFVTSSAEPFPYGRTGMPHVRMEIRGGRDE